MLFLETHSPKQSNLKLSSCKNSLRSVHKKKGFFLQKTETPRSLVFLVQQVTLPLPLFVYFYQWECDSNTHYPLVQALEVSHVKVLNLLVHGCKETFVVIKFRVYDACSLLQWVFCNYDLSSLNLKLVCIFSEKSLIIRQSQVHLEKVFETFCHLCIFLPLFIFLCMQGVLFEYVR